MSLRSFTPPKLVCHESARAAWNESKLKALCLDAGLNEDGTKNKELVTRLRNAADVLMPTNQDSRPPATSYARRNIACALAIAFAALALVVFPAAIPPLVALVRDRSDGQKANAALAL